MSPSKAMFAAACDVKGPEDAYALNRLENFLKDEGVSKIVYRSDQEPSIIALIGAALTNSGKAGEVTDAAPAHSAVGESQSNGVAERTVQQFEDLIRTLKAALEGHLGGRLPVEHAVTKWLVQHTASIYNRNATNAEGKSPYEHRHGRRSKGRTAEFWENVLYYEPKKLRAKLSLRWRVGIFLGTADRSNEAYIGTCSGNVVKSRSITRVVEGSKWDIASVMKIIETPMRLCPNSVGNQDHSWVDAENDPHAHAIDLDIAAKSDEDGVISDPAASRAELRVRITKRDLDKYR